MVGLYIHIPFCQHKCHYCHFYVQPNREEAKEALLASLLEEWERRDPKLPLSSLYFGGGTPFLFGPDRIAALLEQIQPGEIEITLEANPEAMEESLLRAYRGIGINRLSIGVQSFDDSELSLLTRRHSAKRAKEAIETAVKVGFTDLSIDLMYDLPHQTLASWRRSLQAAAELPITHLSLYNLTIEPHTPFYRKKRELDLARPSEECSASMYCEAVSLLREAGLYQYEISAFAKEGYRAQHNQGYWTGRPFIGLGPSAWSFDGRIRSRNQLRISCPMVTDEVDDLPPEARHRELLAVGLRLVEGVPLDSFANLSVDLHKLEEEGFLLQNQERVQLTERGRLFYDEVAERLI